MQQHFNNGNWSHVTATSCTGIETKAANMIELFSSLSSTYFSKLGFSNLIIYEFKFEFDNKKLFQVRVQADEYPKSRQLFHHWCSCN